MLHVINSCALTGKKQCINKAIHALFVCLFVLRFYGPVNPMGSCRVRSVYLTTRLLGRLSSKRLTSIVHILSPETDNCPSWISGRERMTVENISWSISTLLMHGYTTFNMPVPGPHNCCRHEMCSARPLNEHSPWKLRSRDISEMAKQNRARKNAKCSKCFNFYAIIEIEHVFSMH